jgi:polyhydroxyalkanoate synthesis regulator phasin
MKRSKNYSWPSSPLNHNSKRSPKKQKQLKTLMKKLNQAASNNSSLSADIQDLKESIKDLTNLD